MSDTYTINEHGQVVPYTGGRRCNDTRAYRDATAFELQLLDEVKSLEGETAALEAKLATSLPNPYGNDGVVVHRRSACGEISEANIRIAALEAKLAEAEAVIAAQAARLARADGLAEAVEQLQSEYHIRTGDTTVDGDGLYELQQALTAYRNDQPAPAER